MKHNKARSNLEKVFCVNDCAIITCMGGIGSALNLRELKERISVSPDECLYYHFCENLISPTFDDPEFHNDFAIWAARNLQDNVLAERLGIINPYSFESFEALREKTIEIIDDRLSELNHVPAAKKGEEFFFQKAVTVVFDAGITLRTPADFVNQLPHMSNSTIYYHFLEARRRTTDRVDDFTFWLKFLDDTSSELISALSSIDFYFLSLTELKHTLIETAKGIRL